MAWVLFLGVASRGESALQREWVRTYSLASGITNRGLAIAVAPDGNVVVAGTSYNEAGNADYLAIKYSPAGEALWTVRYDAPGSGHDLFTGMALDPAGNLFLTGTTETLKINPAGVIVWAAAIRGRAVAANADYVYVTGTSDVDFMTTQLENNETNGRDLWVRIEDGPVQGIDIAQAIALDASGNVYVAGQETMFRSSDPRVFPRVRYTVFRYTVEGVRTMHARCVDGTIFGSARVNTLLIAPDQSIFVFGESASKGYLFKFDSTGTQVWPGGYSWSGAQSGTKMTLDSITGYSFVTGHGTRNPDISGHMYLAKVRPTGGEEEWLATLSGTSQGQAEGNDVALDSARNVYVTGYAPNGPNDHDLFLSKYNQEGVRIGLDRYNSPHGGSDFGQAMVIDTNGNVYVTGYSVFVGGANNGGSEFLTVKYSAAPKIEMKVNGAMRLQFHAAPGQRYAIEATTNFINWQSLITNTANASGIVQFDDEEAPTTPFRFYRGKSAP